MKIYQKPDAVYVELTTEEDITATLSTGNNNYDDDDE